MHPFQTPQPHRRRNQLSYACSGCCDSVELADRVARELTRSGTADMSCLAGIGGVAGQIDPLLPRNSRKTVSTALLDRHARHCRLTNPERIALAEKAKPNGQGLSEVINLVQLETLLKWHRKSNPKKLKRCPSVCFVDCREPTHAKAPHSVSRASERLFERREGRHEVQEGAVPVKCALTKACDKPIGPRTPSAFPRIRDCRPG